MTQKPIEIQLAETKTYVKQLESLITLASIQSNREKMAEILHEAYLAIEEHRKHNGPHFLK